MLFIQKLSPNQPVNREVLHSVLRNFYNEVFIRLGQSTAGGVASLAVDENCFAFRSSVWRACLTASWFRMSHRLVQEQLDQLTAFLLTAHEDGDLDEEELLLLTCGVEDAAASLLPPFQFALISWMKRPVFDVFNCSFVLDCFLLQFSLFLCCSRRFKRSPANFLERPAKRSGCRLRGHQLPATSSRAGPFQGPGPFSSHVAEQTRNKNKNEPNKSCRSLSTTVPGCDLSRNDRRNFAQIPFRSIV